MTLTDPLFIFYFLPLALMVYYLGKSQIRPYILLLFNLLFYAFGDMNHIAVLLFSLTVNCIAAWCLARTVKEGVRRLWLALGIGFNVWLLCRFKYMDFAIANVNRLFHMNISLMGIMLPLGISIFTFKAISYLIDIYRGEVQISSNPVYGAVYLSFFGQIQSGPVSRYGQMPDTLKWSWDRFSSGLYRFVQGFNKKVLLADVINHITREAFDNVSAGLSAPMAWLGAISFSLELYYDFSGYSDMAIGISQMFGITCPENFQYPYMADSVSEFWRRWHITLGAWFRDYIYFPLGGSRVGRRSRICVNLLVVWLLTGLWHGSSWNFVFWGLGNGAMIALEKMLDIPGKLKDKAGQAIWRIVTILFFVFQCVIFRANGLKAGLCFIRAMFFNWNNTLAYTRAWVLLQDYRIFLIAGLLLCIPLLPGLKQRAEKDRVLSIGWNVGQVIMTGGLFILSLSFVIAGQNNPFAYANF